MESISNFIDLLKTTYQCWSADKVGRLGASLAYYAALSLAPTLVILLTLVSILFGGSGSQSAQSQIVRQTQQYAGQQAAGVVQNVMENVHTASGLAQIATLVVFAITATTFFSHLQGTLNTIWNVEPKDRHLKGRAIRMLKKRAAGFALILVIGFILIASLFISTAVSSLDVFLPDIGVGTRIASQVVNYVILFVVALVLFAAIFKVLPDVNMAWKDVWLGAAVTALLFAVGNFFIAIYLTHSSLTSFYGAAGGFMALLLWVFYSAQIFFVGAEFTQVYANRYGDAIEPDEDAQHVSPKQQTAVESG